MKEITTFKQIKEIIEPIPADKFCKDKYENNKGQSCFLGHIQKHISGNASGNNSGVGVRELTRVFIEEVHNVRADGTNVNNVNTVNGYNEPEIKDRLMHMIEDGIKWEESKLTT